VLRLKGKDRKR